MPIRTRQGLTAGVSVVVAAAIGVVTNLVTDQWSIGLGAALLVLVVAAVMIQVSLSRVKPEPPPPSGRQHVTASGNAVVIQAGRDVVNPEQPQR